MLCNSSKSYLSGATANSVVWKNLSSVINSVMWRFVVICKLLCGENIAQIVAMEKNLEICDIFKT